MHEWHGIRTLLSMRHLPLPKFDIESLESICMSSVLILWPTTYLSCPDATPYEGQLNVNERQDLLYQMAKPPTIWTEREGVK